MAAPKRVDYERMEADWRAGIKSPATMAKEHTEITGQSVSHAAVIKHFRKLGIERDLTAKVHAKADAIVMARMVNATPADPKKDAQIVAEGAAVVAEVRIQHRTDIQRSKRIVNKLMERLESISLPPEPSADAAESERTAKNALALAALKEHAGVVKQLIESQRVVVAMEREAFGIAQFVEAPEQAEQVDRMEQARRIAFTLASAEHQIKNGAANG